MKKDKLFDIIGDSLSCGESLKILETRLDRELGETCAVLVLDSTGFSRTTQAHGITFFLSILKQLRDVCNDIFVCRNVISWRGFADNIFAEFSSVDEALEAAFDLHRYFETHQIPLTAAHDTFGVCVGIGFGRVLRSSHEGVYGDEMNLASKLGEDIAKKGQTLLTQAAFYALSKPDLLHVSETQVQISGVDLLVYDVRPI